MGSSSDEKGERGRDRLDHREGGGQEEDKGSEQEDEEDEEVDEEEAVVESEKEGEEDKEDKEEDKEGNGNSPLDPPGLAQLAEAQAQDDLRVTENKRKKRQPRTKRGQPKATPATPPKRKKQTTQKPTGKQTTLGFGSPTRKSARVAAAQSPKN